MPETVEYEADPRDCCPRCGGAQQHRAPCLRVGRDTPQHPAAPETETDANGLTEAEREALADEIRAANIPILMGWRPGWLRVLAEGLAPIVAERVRVVEGERDECLRAGEEWRRDAESAEAAHEADKAAHERLRAGVREVIDARGRGDFSPLLPKLRALLGGEA